ncbi:MAG: sensor histidine kinase [Bacteroidota bacterium]
MIRIQLQFLKSYDTNHLNFDSSNYSKNSSLLAKFFFHVNKGDFLFYLFENKNIEARNEYLKSIEISTSEGDKKLVCEGYKKLLMFNKLSYLTDNSTALYYVDLYKKNAYDEYEQKFALYFELLFNYRNDPIYGEWNSEIAQELENYAREESHHYLNAMIYNLLAIYSYNNLNLYSSAVEYNQEAIRSLDKIESKYRITEVNRAYTHLLRCHTFEGEMQHAISVISKMDTSGSNKVEKSYKRYLHFYQSIVDTSFSRFRSGYLNLWKYTFQNDKAMSYENLNSIRLLETKYQTEKKENEIALQKAEIKQKTAERNNLLVSLAVIVFLVIALVIFYIQRQKNFKLTVQKNEVLHNQRITKLLQEQENKTFDAMLTGQEQERKRVAEDLHDRLGSLLSATKMHFEAATSTLPNSSSEQIGKIGELLDRAVTGTRQIAHNMLSGVLTKFGLQAALEDLKETIETDDGLSMILEIDSFARIDGDTEIQLYRIVQECVSNTLKHARASEIIIKLTKSSEVLYLIIGDNGVGFDTNKVSNGIGLDNIRNRAKKIGAKASIQSEEGNGTNIKILLPT